MICILARRGRFLETILQDGARSGVPRTRREPHRREVRTPTARPLRLAREAAAAPVSHCRRRKRGSRPKTATVERREGSRSPRDRVVARRRRDRTKECACRRSIHPSSGVTCGHGTKGTTNPHASLRRGNEKGAGSGETVAVGRSRNAVVRSLVASGCLTSLIWREAWMATHVCHSRSLLLCRSRAVTARRRRPQACRLSVAGSSTGRSALARCGAGRRIRRSRRPRRSRRDP